MVFFTTFWQKHSDKRIRAKHKNFSGKDGSFPEKFREANRYRHNPYFNGLNENRLNLNLTEIENWVKSNGSADKIFQNLKDYFLYRAIDHFNAYLNTHFKIEK